VSAKKSCELKKKARLRKEQGKKQRERSHRGVGEYFSGEKDGARDTNSEATKGDK